MLPVSRIFRLKTGKASQIVGVCLALCLTFILSLPAAAENQNIAQTEQTQPELEKVSLQLKWLHQFQFAGFYAAKIKGFYAEEGLDVTIKERDLLANNIEQVINKESEYGIADSMLMLYQAKGAPVKIVSAIMQHSPQVFMTLSSSGIDSPYDLQNKNIAFYQRDTDGFPLLAMLHQNKIQVNTNRMIIKGDPEMLEKGQVDVYPGYLSNETFYFYEKGIDINIIRPLNFGVDLYGDLIFTHNDEIKNHPDRVARFKRASIRGWYYALQHKDEIISYLINELKVNKSYEHLKYEADAIEDAISPKTVPIGTLNPGRLEYTQKLFESHKLINNNIDLSKGIYKEQQHKLKLSRVEKAWIKRNPEIKVAVDTAWQPIEFINEKGELEGLAAEYLDHLSAMTGIKFLPQTQLTWTQSVDAVKNGEVAMFSAVVETPERAKFTNFTPAYLNFPMVISTQKGENYIKDLATLKNKTLAVVRNYAAHELIEKNYKNISVYLVDNVEEGLNAVASGLVYGYVDNLAVVAYHLRALGLSNLQITGETSFNANIRMAVNKEIPELHSILSKALASMDETLQNEISNRWLKVEYRNEFDWKSYLLYASPAIIISLVILLYSRKLRRLNKELKNSNTELLETKKSLESSNERLEILGITDFLTGAYNRKRLDQVLMSEIERSQRYGNLLSILMIDLDNFKSINDKYGHLAGDEILKLTYNTISQQIRRTDTLGRWGGEEFMVICPETGKQQALQLAEKILDSVTGTKTNYSLSLTVSIGITEVTMNDSLDSFVERADKNLYRAKQLGKNQAYL